MHKKTLILTLLLLLFTPFDYIIFLRWLDGMKNYEWLASSVIYPLIHIPYFLAGTLYYNKLFIKEVSQKKLMIIGMSDGLNALLISLAAPNISILLISILNRLTIPLVQLLSFIFLDRRYKKNHYLGVHLTLIAVLVSFIPVFDKSETTKISGLLIYLSSLIPNVTSYILKEKWIQKKTNEWSMNLWIAIWQSIFGLLLFPVVFWTSYLSFFTYIKNGLTCQFLDRNINPNDNCNYNLLFMLLYQFISCSINILQLLIIKSESSTLYNIIYTVKVPIQIILSSFKSIGGEAYSKLNWYSVLSFILIIISTIVYTYKDEIKLNNLNEMDEPLLDINVN